ncbi:MAG: MazG nucleotide pyrophosphohydrolase domain-containing protein [Dehalococcoidia bacterium]
MNLEELSARAMEVRHRYRALEEAKYDHAWTREDVTLGLVGDVGDLCKLVMAKAGLRTMRDTDDRIAHELADVLWSTLVLAEMYEVDLQAAFLKTMADIERHIDEGLQEGRDG